MYESPGRGYFEDLRRETGFTRDPLEKMYRLVDLLKSMYGLGDLGTKLALKGGTAIQLLFFGLSRLSVDVDLNYVGSPDRDTMQKDRKVIRETLKKIFREKNYTLADNKNMYALEQFDLNYIGVAGNMDRLKIEINYIERLPVLPLKRMVLSQPFDLLGDVAFQTYAFEEHMAMKTRALLTRGTPRDLYDIYRMIKTGIVFDMNILKKLTLFYLILTSIDVRTITSASFREIDERAVSSNLSPLLKIEERGIDPEEMKGIVTPIMENILDLNHLEKDFLDIFYDQKRFVQDLLFGEMEIEDSLDDHPALQWRLKRLQYPNGPGEM